MNDFSFMQTSLAKYKGDKISQIFRERKISFCCVCMCLLPFTMKGLSVWNSCNVKQQINDVMLKT